MNSPNSEAQILAEKVEHTLTKEDLSDESREILVQVLEHLRAEPVNESEWSTTDKLKLVGMLLRFSVDPERTQELPTAFVNYLKGLLGM